MAVRIPLNCLNAFQVTLRDVTIRETQFAPVQLVFSIGGPNDFEHLPNDPNPNPCLPCLEQHNRHFVDDEKCTGSSGNFKCMA